ncbi:MAG: hypothetical protein UR89_C0015G0004 [Candidatus Roizmanbacteria bacterium GW2011_GWA2_35_8]|uniref:Uncharacterized protein n=1 Tax=Candidatus Roizmanbacteria bacterium GW2011_GWA2_35_8 TaxID=1618479 RepID=A0A0G0DDK0_9BACT|nr:MAG: hypothetical protein UR89_C0015G0004 [Candidatus Roizmanbacteria bacterium GW2011_GWA2_35_8]
MIKPINISPLNTTNKIYFECSNCGMKDTLTFENRIINTDNEVDLKELQKEMCPKCGRLLD